MVCSVLPVAGCAPLQLTQSCWRLALLLVQNAHSQGILFGLWHWLSWQSAASPGQHCTPCLQALERPVLCSTGRQTLLPARALVDISAAAPAGLQ